MAAYVKQLLELDESRQRATLVSLSRYAETKDSAGNRGLAADSMACAMPEAAPAVLRPEARRASPPPSQLAPLAEVHEEPIQVSNLDAVSKNLQQATKMLQAAMANWEACVQHMDQSKLQPTMFDKAPLQALAQDEVLPAKFLAMQRLQAAQQAQAPWMQDTFQHHGHAAAADPYETETGEDAARSVEKALTQLTANLPPEAAAQAHHHLLEALGHEANAPRMGPPQPDDYVVRWLAKYLEQQQQASVQKLALLLQAEKTLEQHVQAAAPVQDDCWPPRWDLPMAGVPGLLQGLCDPAARAPVSSVPWGHPAQVPLPPQQQVKAVSPAFVNIQRGVGTGYNFEPQADYRKPRNDIKHNQQKVRVRGHFGGDVGTQLHSMSEGNQQANGETLRAHLRSLIKVECSRVLIVRKINRLGFGSPELLKDYYSWYGEVERVLVAHSRVQVASSSNRGHNSSRVRPSGLGFIVMKKTEDAQAILAEGPTQEVYGAEIRVQQFERRMTEGMDGDDTEEQLTQYTNSSNSSGSGDSTNCYSTRRDDGDTNGSNSSESSEPQSA